MNASKLNDKQFAILQDPEHAPFQVGRLVQRQGNSLTMLSSGTTPIGDGWDGIDWDSEYFGNGRLNVEPIGALRLVWLLFRMSTDERIEFTKFVQN